jgi:hypothetical protein
LLDRSFKVSLRNARVFCLNAVVAPTLLPPTVRVFFRFRKYIQEQIDMYGMYPFIQMEKIAVVRHTYA